MQHCQRKREGEEGGETEKVRGRKGTSKGKQFATYEVVSQGTDHRHQALNLITETLLMAKPAKVLVPGMAAVGVTCNGVL